MCLYPNVTALDYQGAVELFRTGSKNQQQNSAFLAGVGKGSPDVSIDITFLGPSLDLVKPEAGPRVQPDDTYDNTKEQFDILLLPGGKPSCERKEYRLMDTRRQLRTGCNSISGELYQETRARDRIYSECVYGLLDSFRNRPP